MKVQHIVKLVVLLALSCIIHGSDAQEDMGEELPWITGEGNHGRIYCDNNTEGNLGVFSCNESEAMDVLYGFYGRTNKTFCTMGDLSSDTLTCDAYKGYYTIQIEALCNGRRSCTWTFPRRGVGDPCPGYSKYLEVHYHCRACNQARWGPDCDRPCYCFNFPCDVNTGQCPIGGCQVGYQGPRCDEVCRNGFFGPNCGNLCYCKGDNCHPLTGICPEEHCLNGWHGVQCNQPCKNGTYGENCAKFCTMECLSCDRFSGCTGCIIGRSHLPDCEKVCPSGTYGSGCKECGKCLAKEPCDIVTGQCRLGCEAGFQGLQCSTGCVTGWFGRDCSIACGHCKGGPICHPVTGKCPAGCEYGYISASCTKGLTSSLIGMVIPLVWALGCHTLGILFALCRINIAYLGYEKPSCAKLNLNGHLNKLDDLTPAIGMKPLTSKYFT